MSSNPPTSLQAILQNDSLTKQCALIGPDWTEGAKHFPIIDPATGQEFSQMADVGRNAIVEAISHAHQAFQTFGQTSEYERAAILEKWATKTLVESKAEV
ncbi:hypothetical protein ABOM_010239 [Aspergillus bombycis]|uniref:Aldehyde dehydrogenase domain-containing protein n=1 Tax=Aspergillus bombycis TaxID=109264 RepID=A0A1F7ZNN5_9EURO|nr:hypothetical protein ABOM_010239 [Aspergillus bombycis]OGM41054.1 hypothetical protein ABOM_010239 [Aspergillus bombycis]